jgi:hypothetical protein
MGGVGRGKDERWEGVCDFFLQHLFRIENFFYLKMSYYRNEQERFNIDIKKLT